MFESLQERLGSILNGLTGRGALSEADVSAALREVRRALLEADVALDVVRSFTDRVRADSFLRAFIEKTSGRTSYQLYATITYTGQWRTFESGTFSTPAGPMGQPLTVIDHSVSCTYSVCVYIEVVALVLTESFLRQLAQRADERPVAPWRFRFKARDGEDWTDDMAPAEAAGLLLAVDRYRSGHKLP